MTQYQLQAEFLRRFDRLEAKVDRNRTLIEENRDLIVSLSVNQVRAGLPEEQS